MPGLIGPLLATGVALSVAVVVVANPVIAPRADLQVPAIQLSGTGDAMDMLNKDFLSAVGPAQADSASTPFAVLKDLISTLAADASYLGRSAIVAAFFAGATAVTNPKLTAASHPYVPAPPYLPPPALSGGPVGWPAPAASLSAAPVPTGQLLAAAALRADLVPVAAEVVEALLDGLHGLSEGEVATAAFAAGALLVTEVGRVVETLRGLAQQGVEAALNGVLTAVGDPQKPIIRAIRGIIEQPLPAMPSPVTPSGVAAPTDSTSPTTSLEAVGAERIKVRKPAQDVPVVLPHPVVELNDAEVAPPEGLKDGTDTTNRVRVPALSGRLKHAVTEDRNQAHDMVGNVADAVREAAGRAGKAVAGRSAD